MGAAHGDSPASLLCSSNDQTPKLSGNGIGYGKQDGSNHSSGSYN